MMVFFRILWLPLTLGLIFTIWTVEHTIAHLRRKNEGKYVDEYPPHHVGLQAGEVVPAAEGEEEVVKQISLIHLFHHWYFLADNISFILWQNRRCPG